MRLPGRSLAEEDAYVTRLSEAPPDDLLDAIDAAMAERRPRLAARLVALLPADATGRAAEAARRAAALVLVGPDTPDPSAWNGLEEAWAELRRRRMRRYKQRVRARARARGRGRD